MHNIIVRHVQLKISLELCRAEPNGKNGVVMYTSVIDPGGLHLCKSILSRAYYEHVTPCDSSVFREVCRQFIMMNYLYFC